MRFALADDGAVIQAGPDAPPEARCPACGEPVELHLGHGGYYRHAMGAGADCPLRKKPPGKSRLKARVLQSGDPYTALAVDSVVQAVERARRGSVEAILALAFSPVVYLALDVVGLDPEEVLDIVVPPGQGTPEVLVSDDEATVLEAVQVLPGPIFDVRSWHDGHLAELEALGWYVPLWPVGPARARMVRRVLGLAERVYVLGKTEWTSISGRVGTVGA